MHKITETGPAFCVCAGGLSVCLLYRVSLATSLVTFAAAVLFILYCAFVLSKGGGSYADSRALGVPVGLYSVICAAVSVNLSASLITDGGVMDKSFYPLIVLLTGLFAVCYGMSNRDGAVTVSFVTAAIGFGVLLVLMFLCVLRTGFEMLRFDAPDRKLLLLLTAFSVFDVAIVLPLLRGKPLMMLCGGLAAHLYGAVMTVLAVSVLTNKIFNDSSMPWMTLWRSTFITSFLNSFEILGICAFFILNAVKAGIAVKTALDIFNTKYAVFVLLGIFAVSVLLTLFSGIFYAAAVLSVIFGLLAPAFSLLIKYRQNRS